LKIIAEYDNLIFMNRSASGTIELETLKQKLHSLFSEYGTIRSAYMFGSTVAGVASEKSDLDVAIRLEPDVSPEDAFGVRLALIDDLETLFHCPVDVVILNSASLKLIHQVFRYGRPMYIQHPDEEREYRIRKQKEYFDFQYYINKECLDLRDFYGA